jgi:hypothetical protein
MRDLISSAARRGLQHWRRLYLRVPILPPAFFCMILGYELCNEVNTSLGAPRWYSMSIATSWDWQIPFLPGSLPLYLSFISFYFLPKALLRAPVCNEACYGSLHQALQLTTVISCAIFLLAPTPVELRAQATAALSGAHMPYWLLAGCQGLFAIDGQYNAWPSLHVSQPLLIMLVVQQLRLFSPLLRRLLWLHWVLVAASVVTMKQHYLWDVATAIGLALWCWWYWLSPRLRAASVRAHPRVVLGGVT